MFDAGLLQQASSALEGIHSEMFYGTMSPPSCGQGRKTDGRFKGMPIACSYPCEGLKDRAFERGAILQQQLIEEPGRCAANKNTVRHPKLQL
jgi:hypothetical protein